MGLVKGGGDSSDFRSSIIAEYNNGVWRKAGSLMRGRSHHKAINIEGTIMIIGGCYCQSEM